MTRPAYDTLSTGHGLLEGPIWHPKIGFMVADAAKGGVWSFADGEDPVLRIAHRRGIGGMALHETGGLVVSGRNVALKWMVDDPRSDDTAVLLANDPAHGMVGFNDLTTDARGRVYVGSLGYVAMNNEDPAGRAAFLHRIELDGSATVVADDVQLTNGLGWSPDGRRLYHSDSLRNIVKVYDLQGDDSLSPPREFARTPFGHPDGLAVAEDGSVWFAVADGHAVCRFTPDGQERQRIEFPVPMVTSLCFGGEDMRDLYVVSGSRGAPAEVGACVFRVRTDVPGLPRAPARVAVPRS